jgi:hypothetical protein
MGNARVMRFLSIFTATFIAQTKTTYRAMAVMDCCICETSRRHGRWCRRDCWKAIRAHPGWLGQALVGTGGYGWRQRGCKCEQLIAQWCADDVSVDPYLKPAPVLEPGQVRNRLASRRLEYI